MQHPLLQLQQQLLLLLLFLLLLQQQPSALAASGILRTSQHAGTWFPGNATELRDSIDTMLEASTAVPATIKAFVAPHAAFSYSGSTAAAGYKQMLSLNRSVKRVVLLATWHKKAPGLLLPPEEFGGYSSPIGSVFVDQAAVGALLSTGLYDIAPTSLEAQEHSISVQIPFLKRVLPEGALLLPIYVGVVADYDLAMYAETLVSFFMDPDTIFIVSSDFSHWGPRYNYSYLPPDVSESLPLSRKIQALDQEAIDCIIDLNVSCLEEHMNETHNQICGYDGLRLLLMVIGRAAGSSGRQPKDVVSASLLKYSQSNAISRPEDSMVGYASIGFFRPE